MFFKSSLVYKHSISVPLCVGFHGSLTFTGCVDVWEPKVVRSAAGAHFRLPIHYSIDWEDMSKYLEEHTSVFVADSNAKVSGDTENEAKFGMQMPVLPYYSVEYATLNHITVIVGGETEGISEESYR